MSESLFAAFIVIAGYILSVCCHEYAHAFVAYHGGDEDVEARGYLSFNPLVYIDINRSLTVPLFIIMMGGIALPGASVEISMDRLRSRAWCSLVSAAGPLANLVCAIVLIPLAKLHFFPGFVLSALAFLLKLEIVVFILNLLPIPGLDGFGIIEPYLSAETQAQVHSIKKFGVFGLLAFLMFVPVVNSFIWHAADSFIQLIGISLHLVSAGEAMFRKNILACVCIGIIVCALTYFAKSKLGEIQNTNTGDEQNGNDAGDPLTAPNLRRSSA